MRGRFRNERDFPILGAIGMPDHDQLFNTLLKEFLPDFFALFFPQWQARFDSRRVEWLEAEFFSDTPRGSRRTVDLVVKLPLRNLEPTWARGARAWLSLIHIEVESADGVAEFRERMCWY